MSDKIIEDKFAEWTEGLEPVKARVSVFEHIRDIPYALIPELRDFNTGPAGILKICKGSCIPKHFLLGMFFEKLGIPVKYVTYLFTWDDPAIKYPPDLRKIVKYLPIGTHLACKAYIQDRWVLVDATWDSLVKKAGFPVNENWDGFSNTKNAVKHIKEIIHDSAEDRIKYAAEYRKTWAEDEISAYEKFPVIFNAWLEVLRKQ